MEEEGVVDVGLKMSERRPPRGEASLERERERPYRLVPTTARCSASDCLRKES